MSQFHVASVICRGDHPFLATVATSLNVGRRPAARSRILTRRFHRYRCPECQSLEELDTPLVYIDPERRVLALVSGEEGSAPDRQLSTLEYATELEELGGGKKDWSCLHLRSLCDLRERLVAQEMGLGIPQVLELLTPSKGGKKERARVRDSRTVRYEDGVAFACHDREDGQVEEMPIRAGQPASDNGADWKVVDLDADTPTGDRATAREDASALVRHEAAARSIDRRRLEDGVHRLRYLLPRGARLTEAERTALRKLRAHARKMGWDATALQIATLCTGLDLSPEVHRSVSAGQLDKFCGLLQRLPWAEARANRELQRLELAAEGSAAYEWESGTLYFGADVLNTIEGVRRRLVHEIGHSVHDAHADSINFWLHDTFGWDMYDVRAPNDEGIKAWIEEMGGWPKGWGAKEKALWTDRIRNCVVSPDAPELPARVIAPRDRPRFKQDPLKTELDEAERAGFLAAPLLRRPQGAWWLNPNAWVKVGDRRFAFNFYYGGLMVVSEKTLGYIAYLAEHADDPNRPLGEYAAMSPLEFFAELYVVMRHRVSGYGEKRRPIEEIRDQFFLNVWGRHDRTSSARAYTPTWAWAMDSVRNARKDVGQAVDEEPEVAAPAEAEQADSIV